MSSSDALGTSRLRVSDGAGPGEWVAYSFLGMVLGLLAALLLWAVSNVLSSALCGTDECALGWMLLGGMLSLVAGLLVPMLLIGLGWAWWAVLAAAVFSTPLWIFLSPLWVTGVLMVLVAPVVAGLAGRWARSGPPWRTWVLLGVAAALLVATAVSVLVA